MLLYTFLVIFFAQPKECMVWPILLSKFSDVLTTFTCAKAMGDLWSICLRATILSYLQSETLRAKAKGCSFTCVSFLL